MPSVPAPPVDGYVSSCSDPCDIPPEYRLPPQYIEIRFPDGTRKRIIENRDARERLIYLLNTEIYQGKFSAHAVDADAVDVGHHEANLDPELNTKL